MFLKVAFTHSTNACSERLFRYKVSGSSVTAPRRFSFLTFRNKPTSAFLKR